MGHPLPFRERQPPSKGMIQMATQTMPLGTEAHDTFPINGTDFIEFYVGTAKQAAHFYQSAFGFQLAAYRGPETGVRDRVSYLLTQNKIRLVLTSPLGPDGEIAEHVRRRTRRLRESDRARSRIGV
jgi:4-hydroxyphenylpyruvate dioxygenase